MFNFWTTSKLGKLPYSIKKDVRFYAPLVDNLDFMGIDPVTFVRPGTGSAVRRDGLFHNVAANVPIFQYNGELPLGLFLSSGIGEILQFSAQNGLDDANTLIWFENGVPKSTPTNANPISSSGIWSGNLNIHVNHLFKTGRVLANSEITTAQLALADVAQAIPAPPPPVLALQPLTFVSEVPSGAANSSNPTFTLSNNPDLNTILLFYSGLALKRVASSPGNMEYTLSGTGNKTITMGLPPAAGTSFFASYVTA